MKKSEECTCGDDATLGATIKLHCQKCSNVREKFSIKKPFKVAAITAILAYGGSNFIDYAVTDNRYPIATEFEILNACINNRGPSSSKYYHRTKDVCFCAMEDTMNQISSTMKRVTDAGFLKAFTENAEDCKEG